MAKANLLIEVVSLAASIAMLALNANLLPSAECSYVPHRWWWFKKNPTTKQLKTNTKEPQKAFPWIKTTYMEFLVFSDLSAKGHSDSNHPSSPERWPSPKPGELWCRCSSKLVLGEDVIVPSWAAPSPLPPSVAQPRQPCRLWTVHRYCPAVGRWPLWEGPPSPRSLLRPALSLPVLSWGWQFKQALSLCIQSRFMRADKDVTSLLCVFIKTLFPSRTLLCYVFLFFLSSLNFRDLLKKEERVGRKCVMLTWIPPIFLQGRILKPQSPNLVAWLTQPYLYLISYVIIIGYLIVQ